MIKLSLSVTVGQIGGGHGELVSEKKPEQLFAQIDLLKQNSDLTGLKELECQFKARISSIKASASSYFSPIYYLFKNFKEEQAEKELLQVLVTHVKTAKCQLAVNPSKSKEVLTDLPNIDTLTPNEVIEIIQGLRSSGNMKGLDLLRERVQKKVQVLDATINSFLSTIYYFFKKAMKVKLMVENAALKDCLRIILTAKFSPKSNTEDDKDAGKKKAELKPKAKDDIDSAPAVPKAPEALAPAPIPEAPTPVPAPVVPGAPEAPMAPAAPGAPEAPMAPGAPEAPQGISDFSLSCFSVAQTIEDLLTGEPKAPFNISKLVTTKDVTAEIDVINQYIQDKEAFLKTMKEELDKSDSGKNHVEGDIQVAKDSLSEEKLKLSKFEKTLKKLEAFEKENVETIRFNYKKMIVGKANVSLFSESRLAALNEQITKLKGKEISNKFTIPNAIDALKNVIKKMHIQVETSKMQIAKLNETLKDLQGRKSVLFPELTFGDLKTAYDKKANDLRKWKRKVQDAQTKEKSPQKELTPAKAKAPVVKPQELIFGEEASDFQRQMALIDSENNGNENGIGLIFDLATIEE